MIISDLIGKLREPARFDGRPLDDETILTIIEAARLAPSANNSQIWRFFIVRDGDLIKEVSGLTGRSAFRRAPTIIAACAQPWIVATRGREQPFFMIDIPIAISHVILMARELGIATSVSFDFDETRLLRLVGAPKDYRAVSLIALGYADEYESRPAKRPKDVVHII